ncbi:MAG TPA: hypothetical protein PKZ42_03280 [Syntrophales bacterium]|nr:hypothetical protein [Syntrophales bacterium]
MNQYVLIFFMILGVADFAYGLWSKDRISILIGAVMVFIAFSIMRKGRREKEKKSSEGSSGEKG